MREDMVRNDWSQVQCLLGSFLVRLCQGSLYSCLLQLPGFWPTTSAPPFFAPTKCPIDHWLALFIQVCVLCCTQGHFNEFVPHGHFMALCAALTTTDFIWIRPVLTGNLGDWIRVKYESQYLWTIISQQVQNFLNPCNLEKSLKTHADIYRGTYCRGGPGREG